MLNNQNNILRHAVNSCKTMGKLTSGTGPCKEANHSYLCLLALVLLLFCPFMARHWIDYGLTVGLVVLGSFHEIPLG